MSLDNTKGIFSSVTIWGALIAIGGAVLDAFGFDSGPLNGAEGEVATVVGGIIAIIGRIRAVKKVK